MTALSTAQLRVHPLRRLAERMVRNMVVRRRLPRDFGHRPIYLSPGNRLRALDLRFERFEPQLIGFVRRFVKSGMVVWDIGANMGAFALPAAHAVGRGHVVAIEPDPFNQLLLHRSRAANSDLDMIVVPAAISDRIGLTELIIATRGRAGNALAGADHGSQMGGMRMTLPVVTLTLDWLAEQRQPPDLIKCDAEGAEAWILAGGAHVLSAHRPIFIMEVPRENADRCTLLFHQHRYGLFPADRPITRSAQLAAIGDAWEIVAIPADHVDEWIGT